ncbi:FAD-dependent monooxygenase [Pusillimonas sp.]|uniref:FAD-dependent monooxygenase n=1 Tax=Pusillimonas sp. TaxID=3040095 RepID=UPI0029A463F6|nr:FAD-dependent monooxygenase [Pusillimonas sp.]MDX3893082.1 FAD-dependent monooxygenase [Pusillimonas sp.]
MNTPLIGICGGGIGGLAAAIALRKLGQRVVVFEQAPQFARVGADINLTPNAVRALDGLGVGDALRETAARPAFRISRDGYTGEETSRLAMSSAAEEKYGAPQLTMHRADLLTALEAAVPADCIKLGKKAVRIEQVDGKVRLDFADGSSETVDALVGADGIHSVVRTAMLGPEQPQFTGVVAYRAVVPAERLEGCVDLDCFTKWWGDRPEVQVVSFPLNQGKDIFIFATTPQPEWQLESWTAPGDVAELKEIYSDFHADARARLNACTEVLKSALYIRDPLPHWYQGNLVLLGDAAHPMMPFMAQGAGQAVEDAVVLARCIAEPSFDSLQRAWAAYQNARLERTSRIQIASRSNTWLKEGGNADWVYDYDAWTAPLK